MIQFIQSASVPFIQLATCAGRHSNLIAAHAIANLAAFRSGYDEAPQSRYDHLLGAAPAAPPNSPPGPRIQPGRGSWSGCSAG